MTRKEKIAVFCRVRDLDQAQDHLHKGYKIGAGTAHISRQLQKRGIEHLCLNEFVTDEQLSENLDRAWSILEKISQKVQATWSPDLTSAVLTRLAKVLLSFYLQDRLEARLASEILYVSGSSYERALQVENSVKLSQVVAGNIQTNVSGLQLGHVWGRRYRLDFRSLSGKQVSISGDGLINIVIKPAPGKKAVSIHRNALRSAWKQRSFRPNLEVALDVPEVEAPDCVFQLSLQGLGLSAAEHDFTLQAVRQAAIGFASYRSAMVGFLNRNGLPHKAIFNHVRGEGLAGFASALREAGVECRLHSHGALMAFGNTSRHKIVDIIGAGHFNSAPSMTHLVPRSPLQVQKHDATQIVEQVSRLSLPDQKPTAADPTFKLYYAPNFLPWTQNLWGIAPSCFDTIKCIEALCDIVAKMPQTDLYLRIKTTTKDTAQKGQSFENRALYPQDVDHVINPEKGIIDASTGSHKEFLDYADLVITEGLTSVMFDALEARKPVLLLNRSPTATPAMPAWSAPDLLGRNGRSAIYAACLNDSLKLVIEIIRARHRDQCLSDEELKGYVWT